MEQITKHEWRLHHIDTFGDEIYYCGHCPLKKSVDTIGNEVYGSNQDGWLTNEEPACITRYSEQEAGKDATINL